MPFEKGQSGNPTGRPRGALGKITKYRQQLEDAAPEIISTLIEKAKEGDIQALRICIERLIPKSSSLPVDLHLDELLDKDAVAYNSVVSKAIIRQVSTGEISAETAKTLVSMIESHRKITEYDQLEPLVIEMKELLELQSKNNK